MKTFDAHFVGELDLHLRADGRTWSLLAPFEFYASRIGVIIVPRDFVTDLASIPRLFWNILPPFGKYQEAAVIHDWCYRNHLFTRSRCDRILLLGMKLCCVPRWQRVVIFLAVRALGWIAWRDEKRRLFRPHISTTEHYRGHHYMHTHD